MRKSKQPPKTSPPAGRVLHTSAEQADWLFSLDRRRKLARVARVEAACAEILRQPETDPRRPYVGRLQTLLAAARGNLERGHPADWQLVEIEALGRRMTRLVLEPLAAHGHIMRHGRQRGSYSALHRWQIGDQEAAVWMAAEDAAAIWATARLLRTRVRRAPETGRSAAALATARAGGSSAARPMGVTAVYRCVSNPKNAVRPPIPRRDSLLLARGRETLLSQAGGLDQADRLKAQAAELIVIAGGVMDRRTFISSVTLGLLAVPLAAEAQQTGKVYRIGFLGYAATCDRPAAMIPFREGLRALGYIEGQNIAFECRGGPPTGGRLADLAAELVRLKVDIIVTDGTASALAAKQATNIIPIVMVYVADPVGSGLVTSLARPGGNVTGLSVLSPGIVQKALGILKEIAPRISRVGVWMDPTNPGQTLLDEQMNAAAKILGITPQRVDVRSAAKLDGAFAAALEQRMEALFVYPLPIAPPDRQRIVQFGIKNRLPTVAISPSYVEEGMLVAYGVSGPDLYRRAGGYVDKILRGTKPADLPVEQPTKFELVINLKTAKALGLTIPQSLLLRADQVIE